MLQCRSGIGDRTEDHAAQQDHRQRHLLDLRAEAAEDGGSGAHRLARLPLEEAAFEQLADHADAQPAHVSVECRDVVGHRKPCTELVLRIVAGDRSEDQRRIGDAACHRPGGIHRPHQRQDPVTAHPAPRRPYADDAVIGGRVADRSAGVLAECRRAERRRRSDATTGAGGAGVVLDVPRIPRLAERPIARSEHAPLGHVELSEHYRARVAKPRHRGGVLVWHEVGECSRAVRRAHALGEELILHRDGDAVQRTEPIAAHHRGLGVLCLPQGRVTRNGDVRVQRFVPAVDPVEVGLHEIDR